MGDQRIRRCRLNRVPECLDIPGLYLPRCFTVRYVARAIVICVIPLKREKQCSVTSVRSVFSLFDGNTAMVCTLPVCTSAVSTPAPNSTDQHGGFSFC